MLLSVVLLLAATFSSVDSSTCFYNSTIVNSLSWSVSNGVLQIDFEHKNLTADRWTSLAFGNGPGMKDLEAIVFIRIGDVITTKTGYTPKKKQVILDPVTYVTVENVDLTGDHLKVTLTRPIGPAGPREFSLDTCVNWLLLPGGSMKGEHLKKHHGGITFIHDVCAAKCPADGNKKKSIMVSSNRFE